MQLSLKGWISKVSQYISSSNAPSYTLLWTNSSPTASFSSQTLTLSLSGYDEVEITFKNYTSSNQMVPPIKIPIGMKGMISGTFGASGSATSQSGAIYAFERVFDVSSTNIVFYDGYGCAAGSSHTVRNDMGIPIKIFGIKYR